MIVYMLIFVLNSLIVMIVDVIGVFVVFVNIVMKLSFVSMGVGSVSIWLSVLLSVVLM